ncbi:MAG: DNA polymerase III subunit delta' [Rikenellaceae bacterium]
MRFANILAETALCSAMRESIRGGRVSHAQLFSGAAGYGTLPLALCYVQYLLCPFRSEEDSCGSCPSCQQIEQLSHPDLHFIMPVNKQGKKSGEVILSEQFLPLWREINGETNSYFSPEMWFEKLNLGKTLKGVISAKEADDMVRKLSFKSYSGGYKIVVIWAAELMNEQAANKILKILEEPWDKTLFMLISESPERLLPTIISRTQQLAVPRISNEVILGELERRGVRDSSQREMIARLSGGDKIELERITSGETSEARAENFNLFRSLMRLSYNDKHLELMAWAEDVAALSRQGQLSLLLYSAAMLREAYIIHAGAGETSTLWGEEMEFTRAFAPFIGNSNIEFLIEQIESATAQLTQSGNPIIIFTHFALIVSKQINRL